MIRNFARKLVLALTVAALSANAGTVLAQSATSTTNNPPTSTTPPPTPNSVTGTDPEPQGDIIITVVLALLHLA
jgi:hypothetical protein